MNSEETCNGEWSDVIKGGKGKVNKRKNWTKSARTFTLQNFFTEHGGDGKECVYEDSKTAIPNLDEDELVIKNSILSFFVDLLKRLGPLKRDDIRIQSEYESLSPESQAVIRRFGSLRNFLSCEESIVIVDDYICISSDTQTAQNLALERVTKHPYAFGHQTKPPPTSSTTVASITENSSCSSNAWFKSDSISSDGGGDPIIHLPEMNNLFFNDCHKPIQQLKPVNPIKPPSRPPLVSKPPPNIFSIPPPQVSPIEKITPTTIDYSTTKKFINMSKASATTPVVLSSTPTTIRNSSSPGAAFPPQDENSFHKSLHALTLANAELMAKLEDKNKELMESRSEVLEWKQKAEKSRDSSQLVISLQKQLESEKLNARNLKHQVEMERIYSNKINEKYCSLLKQQQQALTVPPPPMSSISPIMSTSPIIGGSTSSTVSPRSCAADSSYPLSSLSSIWSAPKSEIITTNTSNPNSKLVYSSSTGLPSRKFSFPPPNIPTNIIKKPYSLVSPNCASNADNANMVNLSSYLNVSNGSNMKDLWKNMDK